MEASAVLPKIYDDRYGDTIARKVDTLVAFMKRMKNSMSHAVLTDSLTASSLDIMWEDANVSHNPLYYV